MKLFMQPKKLHRLTLKIPLLNECILPQGSTTELCMWPWGSHFIHSDFTAFKWKELTSKFLLILHFYETMKDDRKFGNKYSRLVLFSRNSSDDGNVQYLCYPMIVPRPLWLSNELKYGLYSWGLKFLISLNLSKCKFK